MRIPILLVCFSCLYSTLCFGQPTILQNRLSSIIDSLYSADQETALIKPADSAAIAYQRVIRTNFPIVENILKVYGYPGFDLVGVESSDRYFTLVQHSDFNLPFQKKALRLMKRQVSRKNASGKNFAFLTDRIQINNGDLQTYGTQIIMSGDTKLKPTKNIENLNSRREKVGLPPIENYLAKCNEVFFQLNPELTPVGNN